MVVAVVVYGRRGSFQRRRDCYLLCCRLGRSGNIQHSFQQLCLPSKILGLISNEIRGGLRLVETASMLAIVYPLDSLTLDIFADSSFRCFPRADGSRGFSRMLLVGLTGGMVAMLTTTRGLVNALIIIASRPILLAPFVNNMLVVHFDPGIQPSLTEGHVDRLPDTQTKCQVILLFDVVVVTQSSDAGVHVCSPGISILCPSSYECYQLVVAVQRLMD